MLRVKQFEGMAVKNKEDYSLLLGLNKYGLV